MVEASTDPRVASAISHWGPRFTTNGVTVADFARVTASLTPAEQDADAGNNTWRADLG